MGNLTEGSLETRLDQLLNMYYQQLTQKHLGIIGGGEGRSSGELIFDPNVTAPVEYNKNVLRLGISDA